LFFTPTFIVKINLIIAMTTKTSTSPIIKVKGRKMPFKDRHEAGQKLAKVLLSYKRQPCTIVLGLPRGGVVTAFEIAKALELPLDVICPRKIGAPHNPELGVGAITESGVCFLNEHLIQELDVPHVYLEAEIEKERQLAQQRAVLYRKNRPPLQIKDSTVILVDDGLATGGTMKVAIQAVKAQKAAKVIVAVPVSPPDTLDEIKALVDQVFCLESPALFYAVGQFYDNFSQTEDQEVIELLSASLS
jgi:putative phosphoribosyl transferase